MKVPGLVLASGLSRRFGPENKLLALVGGVPVARRTIEAYLTALEDVWVVVGHDAHNVRAAIADLPVHVVQNDNYAEGQSASLRAGIAALPSGSEAAIIGVADQPLLRAEVLTRLLTHWRESGSKIVGALYDGRPGNPVLFVRELFPELAVIRGDVGGRAIVKRHSVERIPIEPAWVGMDIDTPVDLERAQALAAV